MKINTATILFFVLSMLAACLVAVGLPQIASMQRANSTTNAASPGLNVVTFNVSSGRVSVYLPDDMAAGDTISGTVIAEPSGKDEAEKQRNAGTLSRLTIEFEKQRFPVAGGIIQRIVLRPEISAPVLILLDEKGKQSAIATLPLAPAPAVSMPPAFVLPTTGQTGRPIEVMGPFDGNSSNTSAKVAGADAKILAESPRKLVVGSPRDVVGSTQIEITEKGNSTTGAFRNLRIDLTAPKTSLLKGESTELRVQISGLQGFTEPVNVQLQNQSPSTIDLSGGNTQILSIPANPTSTSGQQVFTRTVTGVTPGTFNITSNVVLDVQPSTRISSICEIQPSGRRPSSRLLIRSSCGRRS